MKFSSTPFRRHTWPLHRPRKCRSHCDPQKISKEEAEKMIAVWKKDGERGLMIMHGWPEKEADEFLKEWRPAEAK